jgi:hypothetical protein
LKPGSSKISHGTQGSGTGKPPWPSGTLLSLVTPPKEATIMPGNQRVLPAWSPSYKASIFRTPLPLRLSLEFGTTLVQGNWAPSYGLPSTRASR